MDTSFFKRHGSTILTCVGAVGTIATAVMTAKATPKAMRLLEEAEYEKGEDLTKLEKVKTIAPAYIPSVIIGASTLACIFGANILNQRQQAMMASAYAFLSNSYNEYKNKVGELYGDDANDRIIEEIAKDNYESFPPMESEEEELFYDLNSNNYFTARFQDVLHKTVTDDGIECYIVSTPYDTPPWYKW